MKTKNTKRAQAALEFLTTYGWAILVVMVAIGALAYFGVLNPSRTLPERCVFGNGFACADWQMKTTYVTVSLQNGLGQTLYSVTASMTDPMTITTCTVSKASPGPDETTQIECKPASGTITGFTAGEKAKAKITVKFKKTSSGYDQVSLGEVYATVQ